MKKTFSLVAAYLLICVGGTLLGTFIYLLFVQSELYVVGVAAQSVTLASVKVGIFLSFSIVILFSSLFMILYALRHNIVFPTICIFYVLGSITWAVLFPYCLKNLQKISIQKETTEQVFSSSVFRKMHSYLYYFSVTSSAEAISGVRIKIDDVSSVDTLPPEILNNNVIESDKSFFRDSLAEDILKIPFIIRCILKIASLPLLISNRFNSLIDYFTVLSIGLSLMLLVFIKDISKWRLINFMNICLGYFLILVVNLFYYLKNPFLINLEINLNSFLPIEIPLNLVINVVFTLVFILMGVFGLFLRKRRAE